MWVDNSWSWHYSYVIMGAVVSQMTSLTIVYSTVYSGANQRKHQSSASLAFVRNVHRGPVNSPRKWPVKRKMFPFDDVIMICWWSRWDVRIYRIVTGVTSYVGVPSIRLAHHKNILWHTLHNIVYWLIPKQWLMIHISDLMTIVRWCTV